MGKALVNMMRTCLAKEITETSEGKTGKSGEQDIDDGGGREEVVDEVTERVRRNGFGEEREGGEMGAAAGSGSDENERLSPSEGALS